jgi:hypothetical protein
MNTERRAAAPRAAVLLLLAAACGLLLGPAAAQDANKEPGPRKSLPPPPSAPAEVEIITLKNAAANDLAQLLDTLLGGRFGPKSSTPVNIAADQASNTLLVRGSAEQVAQIRELIAKLDVLRDNAPKATEVYSIALKNATATDTVSVLEHLLGGGGRVSIVAVPANNSLLVRGTAEDVAKAREILAKLDVPRDNSSARSQVQVFPLQAIEPDEALEDALQLAFKGKKGTNFSLDRKRKVLVVSADEATLKTVEMLLARLQGEWRKGPDADVQVRVIWLVNGPARPDEAAPPDDLKELLPALAKVGIDRPRLVAQTLVNVNSNARFQARGTAKLEAPCLFEVDGRFSERNETPALEISIRATRPRERGEDNICNLQTTIAAPLGHLVVLGVTPTDNASSVFVVQILPKEAKKATPK